MEHQEMREAVSQLLGLIWRGTPATYKSKYRLTIWTQFESEIRSAAYTSNLGRFINSLCSRLNAEIGRNAADRQAAGELLARLDDRQALKLLREEATLLTLMVRIANQARREQWELDHPEFTEDGGDDADQGF